MLAERLQLDPFLTRFNLRHRTLAVQRGHLNAIVYDDRALIVVGLDEAYQDLPRHASAQTNGRRQKSNATYF